MDYWKKYQVKKAGKNAFAMILYALLILILTLVVLIFVCQKTTVDGDSMKPLLENGEELIIDKVTYNFREPRRFDVIVFKFRYLADTTYVKRIIGLPGESVQIIDGKIYVNGVELEEDYGYEDYIVDAGIASEPMILGEDEYFVLGDNRNVSKDSRDKTIEKVKKSEIIGRAFLRVYPLNKFGFVKHK